MRGQTQMGGCSARILGAEPYIRLIILPMVGALGFVEDLIDTNIVGEHRGPLGPAPTIAAVAEYGHPDIGPRCQLHGGFHIPNEAPVRVFQ